MIDRHTFNRIVLENDGISLHSWEWARAKELLGQRVLWFVLDDDQAQAAFPIMLKKTIRMGWVPHGLPWRGDAPHFLKSLRSFLRHNGVWGMATMFYDFKVSESQAVLRNCFMVPFSAKLQTFILALDVNSEGLFDRFNATTRKHIRKAERAGCQCQPMDREDFERFWGEYEHLATRKGFSPTCSRKFLFTLLDLCREYQSPGLHLLPLKSVYNGQDTGYLVGLRFGRFLLEFLRADVSSPNSLGFEGKLLSWNLIQKAKEEGAQYYDFGGADMKDGISNFKRGFGGRVSEFTNYMLLLAF